MVDVLGRGIRVRALQLSAGAFDVGAAVDDIVAAVRDAAGSADLLVLPELATTRYDIRRAIHQEAPQPGDAMFGRISEAVRRADLVAVVGFAEHDPGGTRNSAAVIDRDGSLVGVARKAHLFEGERAVFAPGDIIAPIRTSLGTLGVLVCFDLELPEVPRSLVLAGADMLVVSSANMEPYLPYQDVYARARAMENGVPLVLSNWTGPGPRFRFIGHSTVVSAQGQVLADAGVSEGFAEATVDLVHISELDPAVDYLAVRRPELYH